MIAGLDFSFDALSAFLDNHAYLAYLVILVWTFIEGETIVIIAGFAAIDGSPNVWGVVLSAFIGSLAGDQTWFYLGRFKGQAFLAKRPGWKQKADKVLAIFERHHVLLILGFRFLYGLRNPTPFALGTSKVSGGRFLILNAIGAGVWALTFAFGGYYFGKAAEKFISDYKIPVLIGAVLFFAAFWGLRVWFRRRKALAAQMAGKVNLRPASAEQPNTPA